MSQFFSPRMLKYRQAAREPIEGDRACPSCDDNLRGLRYGQNCPECGRVIELSSSAPDVFMEGGPEQRERWKLGLTLAALAVGVALAARLGTLALLLAGQAVQLGYVGIGLANSLVWIVAVWLVTPPSLASRDARVHHLRHAARGLALMWIAGYACLILLHSAPPVAGPPPMWLVAGGGAGRLLGGFGVILVILILLRAAESAELATESQRLNAAIWLLPISTLLAQAFPDTIAWFTLVILGFVLLFWSWVMVVLLLGILGIRSHVKWTIHDLDHGRERAARVAQRRRELDSDVERRIRRG